MSAAYLLTKQIIGISMDRSSSNIGNTTWRGIEGDKRIRRRWTSVSAKRQQYRRSRQGLQSPLTLLLGNNIVADLQRRGGICSTYHIIQRRRSIGDTTTASGK